MQTAEHVTGNLVAFREALKENAEFFIEFFLQDEIKIRVPEFHIDLFSIMTHTKVTQSCFAVPRDHAKTTLAKLAVIWHYLFTHYSFIVYLSNTSSIAVAAVNDIIAFIESDNFSNIFGEVEWVLKQDGVGYYQFVLNLPWGRKHCILKALGSGQQVRGLNIRNRRPQLAIVDDLEDNDNIATEELFNKLKKWFYGNFKKALDKFDYKIIQLGNMISNKCMLKQHCDSKYWFSRRYGCLLSNGKPLWEDAWSIEKLKQDFHEYQEAGMADIWFTEMMNNPVMGGKGLIKAEEIFYLPEVGPEHIEYGCITVDLAISERTWAHKTVVTAHGWNGECWQAVEHYGDTGVDPIDLFNIIVAMAFKWKFSFVGIESVAYQASLQKVYEYLALINQIEGLIFVPLTATVRKVQRLAPWAAMIKHKEYALTEGDYVYTEELLYFDPRKKDNTDDYIDSAANIVQMIDNYIMELQDSVGPKSNARIRNSYEICEI